MARAGATYVVGAMLQRVIGILLLPLLTRVLSLEEFGRAGTAVALGGLLAVVFGFGLSFSIQRLYFDDPEDAKRTAWASLLRIQAVAAAAMALLVYATGPLWAPALGDVGWDGTLQVAVVFAWFTSLQVSLMSVMRSAQRPGAFVVITIGQVLLSGGLGIAMADAWGATGYMTGLTIGSVAAVVASFVVTYRAPRWDRAELLEGVRISIPAMFHLLSGWGLEMADRLLVAAILTLEAVGRYQVAYTAGAAITLLFSSVQMAWSPHYMRLPDHERKRLPAAMVVPVTFVALCAAVGLVVCAPLLLAVLAPSSFGGTETVIALIAAASLPRVSYYVVTIVLVDNKRTGRMASASGAGVIVNITLNVALLSWLGLEGAGIATLASIVVMAVVVMRTVNGLFAMEIPEARLYGVWSGGAALLLVLSLIPDQLEWAPVRAVVAGAALYIAVQAGRRVRDVVRQDPGAVPT